MNIDLVTIERLENIPEEVRTVMRRVLSEGLELARKREPPDDGIMSMLPIDEQIGEGMYRGGWDIQACHLTDERFYEDGSYVVVHAYQDSQATKGSIASKVHYTEKDRLALDKLRLYELERRRDQLDETIKRLKLNLGLDSRP
jgi:hypothetical protein